jgi:DNA-binding protein YbaB
VAGELDGAQRWLDDYTRRISEIQHRAEQVQTDIKTMRATASSPDGSVSVVLAPGGRLEKLDLTPKAMDLGHQRLASVIADTIKAAHNDAATRTQQALLPLVGESSAMDFLRDQIELAQRDEQDTPEEPARPNRRPARGNDEGDDSSFGGSILR